MPATKLALMPRDATAAAHAMLAKRSNWAGREPGVIVVFCIIFLVAVLVLALYIHKWLKRRAERKAAMEVAGKA